MELTIRDWMVIAGAAIILAVLVDAIRRVYKDRKSAVRLNARPAKTSADLDDDVLLVSSELPNGGARVVPRDQASGAPSEDNADWLDSATAQDPVDYQPTEDYASEGEISPSSSADAYPRSSASWRTEPPSFSALDDDPMFDRSPETDGFPASEKAADAELPSEQATAPAAVEAMPEAPVPDDSAPVEIPDTPTNLDWLEQLDTSGSQLEPEARLPRGIEPHVFVLNVVSREVSGFAGRDVMHILLACDLRFGDMDFFHRHEQSAGRGPIQFSVCNMMQPGVFDIDNIEAMRTTGLMFFVTLPGPEDMAKAFDYMYETAKTVARNLNGDILDETRSAVTRQSLDHMRQRIRDLERRIAMAAQT